MMQSFINLSNISTGYINGSKRKAVTSGLNGNLYKGELTCLLGPNGMGKSTLLRTLSAFQPSLKGQISVDGRCLGEYSTGELARTISVVLTERPAIPNISVEEFVALGRSPYTGFFGKLTDSDSKIVKKSIEQVGVTNLKDRQWLSLSDGEKQKVMIAKSLAQETPVIFLDEPTAFLDLPSKVEIMHLLHRLARENNKLILLSTHDMELALQMADRLWVLAGTDTLWTGSPEDLLMDKIFTDFFERDGIKFDRKTGGFRVQNKIDYSVNLKGRGFEFGLIKTALMRMYIDAGEEKDSEYTIEIERKERTVFNLIKQNNIIFTSPSIEEISRVTASFLRKAS